MDRLRRDRRLARRLRRLVVVGMTRQLRTLGAAAVALAIATPAVADAAPLSPSVQFAYNTAVHRWGGSGCEAVDAQIVDGGGIAEYSAPGESPCFVYVSRELAGAISFAKVCKTMMLIVGEWHGVTMNTEHLPRICLAKDLFLMNHPHYVPTAMDE